MSDSKKVEAISSLPHRQLRNLLSASRRGRWMFTAAQAAQKWESNTIEIYKSFTAAQAAQKGYSFPQADTLGSSLPHRQLRN